MTLVWQGYIPASLAKLAFLIIVVCLALGRGMGGNVSRLVRFLLRIGLPIASFLTLTVILGGGNWRDIVVVLSGLGTLLLTLIGLYVMFLGLFYSRKRK